jgi:hypothetical protein
VRPGMCRGWPQRYSTKFSMLNFPWFQGFQGRVGEGVCVCACMHACIRARVQLFDLIDARA